MFRRRAPRPPAPSRAQAAEPRARRGIYFAFQGLLTAVLLLLFLYDPHSVEQWLGRFSALLLLLTGSMLLVHAVPELVLEDWRFQICLFVVDAAAASVTLYWTERNPDFFLLYLVILFGTALMRDLRQTVAVAAICSLLYFGSVRQSELGTEFWLRLHFLWIATALLAILARDSRHAQSLRERQYQGRLIQLESLATLGQVAGEVAHRIKGPLTTIRVNAEVLSEGLAPRGKGRAARDPESARRELAQILKEVEHCKAILKDLLSLGRIEEVIFERIDLREPLRRAIAAAQPLFRQRGEARLEAEPLPPMPARADGSLLYEAFYALLQNAAEAVGPGGLARVRAARVDYGRLHALGGAPPEYAIVLSDDGEGIEPEELARVFRPFYTTKGRGGGSGLGLSAALRILQKHGGTIDADSPGKGRGATFTVRLPA